MLSPTLAAGAGDLVILSRGERHVMRDEKNSPVVGLDELIADHPLDDQARLQCGGTGPLTRLLCGGFAADHADPGAQAMFGKHFRATVGESPMRHLARVRLGQAAGYLTTTKLSVDAIARRTCYGTSAALSKAFRREYETSPGRYRENRGTISIEPAQSASPG
jgi:hypothetical protein